MKNLLHVGKPLAHDSAALHVSGAAHYIDDLPELDGTLHVAPGYAPNATCGNIRKLDLSAVRAARGVVAVLTADDVPHHNDYSPVGANDDPILAKGRIDFHGQVIFAVVAETRDQARRAARLAVIDIETEKPVVTIAQSKTDLLAPYAFISKGFKKSKSDIVGKLTIGGQDHFYLEGQVAYAIPQEKGGIHIHSSTQHPSEVQHCVAEMLGIDDAQVTCECRRMGGGFGGKESQAAQWAALAALTAHKTGRPAKCRLDRDDDMIMTGKRHDFEVAYSASLDQSLRISSMSAQMDARCGY